MKKVFIETGIMKSSEYIIITQHIIHITVRPGFLFCQTCEALFTYMKIFFFMYIYREKNSDYSAHFAHPIVLEKFQRSPFWSFLVFKNSLEYHGIKVILIVFLFFSLSNNRFLK